MSHYIRSLVPGATYFFTVALADRRSDLLVAQIGRLRSAWKAVRELHPFTTVAVCVLPDHLHAIWTLPPADADYPLRWQQIKRRFSGGLNAGTDRPSLRAKREAGIWQRRYWEHQIRDEEDLARHVDYVHFNPVKHALVRRAGDWPYSSLKSWIRRRTLPAEWGEVAAAEGLYGEP